MQIKVRIATECDVRNRQLRQDVKVFLRKMRLSFRAALDLLSDMAGQTACLRIAPEMKSVCADLRFDDDSVAFDEW